jgi:AraC-like DNA-binding protein
MVAHACISAPEQGLDVAYHGYRCRAIRIHAISGDEHVVERSRALIREDQRARVFVCLLLDGESFIYQDGAGIALHGGDTLVHETTRPYLHAFATREKLVILDIPADLYASRFDVPATATVLEQARNPVGRVARDHLRTYAPAESVQGGVAGLARTERNILGALRFLLHSAADSESRSSVSLFFHARSYIDARLGDPDLDRERVSAHVGVSVRHLERVFARHGASVTGYIQARRLECACRDLRNAGLLGSTVSDIAFRYGFNSHAHFSRVFRKMFDCTPSQVRIQSATV